MSINIDRPVYYSTEDWFQRYEFAKRIASIVESNKNSNSLTVAIYGKWGQGKTTLLNFIKEELSPDIITIHFNPWLFSETSQLLKSFLDNFSIGLGKSSSTAKEKVGNFFKDYGSAIGTITQLVGLDTTGLQNLGNKLSTVSVEQFKRRIDDFIIEANQNIVVFIDDIDRLDVVEVQQIFKLVKLVGDFPRTSYILSFDHELIAASLAPKYGSGTKDSGYDFLEKIIQLPLNLPKARKQDLRSFTIKLLEKVLDDVKINLDQKDTNEFVNRFDEAFLPALDNPRIAVRFANSINFSIPLLIGEVNLIDLITIEAIRIFYPDLYSFIKNNQGYFINSFSNQSYNRKEKTKEEAKKKITEALEVYGADLREEIITMLQSLFPQLRTVFSNYYYDNQHYTDWYRQMKICSPYYFQRYFSYAIQKGEISDIIFKEVISGINEVTISELINRLTLQFQILDIDEFIFKLYQYQNSFESNEAEILAPALASFGEVYLKARKDIFFGTYGMASSIIFSLLKKIPNENRLAISLKVLDNAKPLKFLIDIQFRFWDKPKYSDELPFLKDEELEKISKKVIEHFEKIANIKNLFTLLPDYEFYRVLVLFIKVGKEKDVTKMLDQQIKLDNKNVINVIKLFTSTITSSAKPYPYKANFNKEKYKELDTIISCDLLYEASLKAYGNLIYYPVEDIGYDELTDENLLALFQKIHNEEKENI